MPAQLLRYCPRMSLVELCNVAVQSPELDSTETDSAQLVTSAGFIGGFDVII